MKTRNYWNVNKVNILNKMSGYIPCYILADMRNGTVSQRINVPSNAVIYS